ncbi:hypothetical protein BV25DRAFT_1992107 [Artomyces pyxidatus]|uniref:Uncharacterized protein n=1 Tax=Artomyces pyxidatus TaxID=48021 RepID=A0ACB8SZQ8_9AGAM|nr:hypothetical protein BV25DRAFT_1992107 [Artomyces pyxidatus]
MSLWREHFEDGEAKFELKQYGSAINSFTKAISIAKNGAYTVYYSRAAVYLKVGMTKAALRDAEKAIDIAPEQWKGYARAAQAHMLLRNSSTALEMARSALELIDDSIENTEARRLLDDISREAIDDSVSRVVHRTNPFTTLAPEIIGMIFEFAVSDIIPLSHVCRHWRTIAITQQSLWRTLVLSDPTHLEKARLWIARSGGRIAKLSVQEDLGRALNTFPYTPYAYNQLVDELKALDWESLRVLRLSGVDLARFGSVMRAINADEFLAHVEELDISTDELFPPLQSASEDATHDVPRNLRALTLRRVSCQWTQLTAHTHCLVSFEAYRQHQLSSAAPIRELLQGNPLLEKLIVHFEGYSTAPREVTEVHSTLTMAHLRHFELGRFSRFTHDALTDGLRLPALEVLRLDAHPQVNLVLSTILDDPGNNLRGLTELRIRSSPLSHHKLFRILLQAHELQKLCINDCLPDANALMTILSEHPSHLYDQYQYPDLASSETSAVPITCPLLAHLDLSQSFNLRTVPLIEMVSARCSHAISTSMQHDAGLSSGTLAAAPLPSHTVAALQSLTIDDCPQIDEATLPCLRGVIPLVNWEKKWNWNE